MHLPQLGRRPGFVVAAVVVGVIVALTVVTISVRIGSDDAAAGSTAPTSATGQSPNTPTAGSVPTPTSASPARSAVTSEPKATSSRAGGSICGLPSGPPLTGRLKVPKATWKYDGATGYPSSSQFGPGRAAAAGFRYCYQHSATGALFAAAGAIAFNNRDETTSQAWSHYSLAAGPYHDQLLHGSYQPADSSIRTKIIGYRLLTYDNGHATVDLAVRVSSSEQTVLSSVLMELVWQRGDWRFSTQTPDPVQATRLVDLAGYTGWSDD